MLHLVLLSADAMSDQPRYITQTDLMLIQRVRVEVAHGEHPTSRADGARDRVRR
jgi:hypothetical protein